MQGVARLSWSLVPSRSPPTLTLPLPAAAAFLALHDLFPLGVSVMTTASWSPFQAFHAMARLGTCLSARHMVFDHGLRHLEGRSIDELSLLLLLKRAILLNMIIIRRGLNGAASLVCL